MRDVSIELRDIYLYIPVYLPGQQRLLRRPRFLPRVGAPVTEIQGKHHINALRNVSFSLSPGQHLALIGHNGAGKSSLLRLLAGIYPPSEGKRVIRGSIGCMFDVGAGVAPEMTGREVIKHYILVRRGLYQGWKDIAEEVAEFTELGEYLDLPTRIYSDGMRARLMAGLATAWQYDILLMDEGIGAGDASFHEKFSARLKNFMGAARLMVMASHNTGLLKEYCSTGLVLNRGEVHFIGPIDDALDAYRAMS